MICPSCGQQASRFHRYSFTSQGVGFRESLKGIFRCLSCGTLLHTVRYNWLTWMIIAVAVVFTGIYALLFRWIIALVGVNQANILFFPLLLAAGYGGTYVAWKIARIEKVDKESERTNPQI
jgi:pheromone shutdown protein TraB